MLASIPGRLTPPDAASRQEGGFSLVVDRTRGIRRLPSLYVNDVPFYADREVRRVVEALERTVDAFVHSVERATYMLTACEIGGRKGLYGTDFFNRSPYRRKLQDLGMHFSDDVFVVFREEGRFESRELGVFDAEFVSLRTGSGVRPAVEQPSGAMLVHQLAFYRIADIDEHELVRLARAAVGLDAFAATSPEDLAAWLSR